MYYIIYERRSDSDKWFYVAKDSSESSIDKSISLENRKEHFAEFAKPFKCTTCTDPEEVVKTADKIQVDDAYNFCLQL